MIIFFFLFLFGCTICEKPFIKVDGSCCIDEDDDQTCDHGQEVEIESDDMTIKDEITVQTEEKNEEETADSEISQEEETLIKYIIKDMRIESDVFEPDNNADTDIFISTIGFQQLKSAELSFDSMCKEDHVMNIFIDEKLLESEKTICGETRTVKIPKNLISEGKNSILFSTAKGPFQIRDAGVKILFKGSDPEEQNFMDFIVESDKKRQELVKVGSISLQNYYDASFDVSDVEYIGDMRLRFNSVSAGYVLIYLNDERIFEGEIEKGAFKLRIPRDKVNIGRNSMRYIILP